MSSHGGMVALRVLSPFFKKNHSEQAPLKITGLYSHHLWARSCREKEWALAGVNQTAGYLLLQAMAY